MKDIGPLYYFLGIKDAYGLHGYLLSQQKYTTNCIPHVDLSDDATTDTPMHLRHKLTPDMGESLVNLTHYQQLVSALVYLTISRPDIAYVVHIVSQYVQASSFCRSSSYYCYPETLLFIMILFRTSKHILVLIGLEALLPVVPLLYFVSFLVILLFLGMPRSKCDL